VASVGPRSVVGTPRDSGGQAIVGIPVTYASSNPAAITIDAATGAMTAVGTGTSNITASAAGVTSAPLVARGFTDDGLVDTGNSIRFGTTNHVAPAKQVQEILQLNGQAAVAYTNMAQDGRAISGSRGFWEAGGSARTLVQANPTRLYYVTPGDGVNTYQLNPDPETGKAAYTQTVADLVAKYTAWNAAAHAAGANVCTYYVDQPLARGTSIGTGWNAVARGLSAWFKNPAHLVEAGFDTAAKLPTGEFPLDHPVAGNDNTPRLLWEFQKDDVGVEEARFHPETIHTDLFAECEAHGCCALGGRTIVEVASITGPLAAALSGETGTTLDLSGQLVARDAGGAAIAGRKVYGMSKDETKFNITDAGLLSRTGAGTADAIFRAGWAQLDRVGVTITAPVDVNAGDPDDLAADLAAVSAVRAFRDAKLPTTVTYDDAGTTRVAKLVNKAGTAKDLGRVNAAAQKGPRIQGGAGLDAGALLITRGQDEELTSVNVDGTDLSFDTALRFDEDHTWYLIASANGADVPGGDSGLSLYGWSVLFDIGTHIGLEVSNATYKLAQGGLPGDAGDTGVARGATLRTFKFTHVAATGVRRLHVLDANGAIIASCPIYDGADPSAAFAGKETLGRLGHGAASGNGTVKFAASLKVVGLGTVAQDQRVAAYAAARWGAV
jgi:hypothetical protein